MAIITGTVAATTATNAMAGATATTGGATLSSAAVEKQVDAIRQLATAFIKSAGMKAVGDSEIVDEFAAPIYAGLAATPLGPIPKSTPPIPGMPTPKTVGSFPELVEPNGDSAIDAKKMPGDLTRIEKPEVGALIDRCYDAPSIKDQLAAGHDKIVIDRNVLNEKVVVSGDKRTAMCLIEERVVDRKYLEYGNLTDLISEVRHGHIPTIRQLCLAIIDLTDLATFKVFRPLLARVKIEPATYRVRQLTADFERKTLESTLEREEKSSFKIDRNEEDRSWFKTNHVTEKIGHKDVASKTEMEIAVTNVTDLCTVDLDKGAIDGLMIRRSELTKSLADANAIARLENTLPSETIASINKTALAWVRENACSTTSEYSTVETFNRYGVDLDGLLGKKIEMSDKQVTESVQTSLREYLSPSDRICLDDINSCQQAIEKFASLQKTVSVDFDPAIVNQYVIPGEGVTFDDGWITYIPGGSIVNLGVKADLGAKITGMDIFWAAVDVAMIAIAIATWGTSTAITSASMAAGKAALKGGAKATVKASAKAAAKTSAKAVAKQSGRIALKNAGRAGAKSAKIGGKASVAKTTTDAATKGATNKVVVKEVQAGAETAAKQSGKVKIKNSGTAGTKAKPSVDVSEPDVTYKNIPRNNGEWTGTPGDSTWKPDPKAVPANTKANPSAKTNAQILEENNIKDGIKFKEGYPDFSNAAKEKVKVTNMTTDRAKNFAQADSQLAAKVRAGKADPELVQMLERKGVDPQNATKGDIARLRKKDGLTWHEHQDKQTMQLIPKELHGSISHKGGISALKHEEKLATQSTATAMSDAAASTASITNS